MNYAQQIWTAATTGEAFDREWDRVVPFYEKWEKERHSVKGIQDIDKHPDRDLIKKGHDLKVLYEQVWKPIYQFRSKDYPWNENVGWVCEGVSRRNTVTGKCNDIPDWRTDNGRKADEAALERKRAQDQWRQNRGG